MPRSHLRASSAGTSRRAPSLAAERLNFRANEKFCCGFGKICYPVRPMAILKKNAFSRRVPDLVTEELVGVLSRRSSLEFKQLFEIFHVNLRRKDRGASTLCVTPASQLGEAGPSEANSTADFEHW